MLLRVLIAAVAWFLAAASALAGSLVLDVLDVGQGDAILIRTEDKAALIDAGLRKAHVVEQLQKLGVDHLDLVVATHPHADHVGGMADVLRVYKPKLYLDNGLPHTTRTYEELMALVEAEHIPYRTARQGMTLRLGGEAVFTVLFPAERPLRGTRSDLNSNSVVLRLDHGQVGVLLMGDAEEPTEDALVAAGLAPAQVLKVAHHGSAHSTHAPFLRAVQPKIALISCGADNRYGHPDPDTVKRLRRAGALVFRTDRSGQIRVLSDGSQVEVLEGDLDELARMPLPWAAQPTPALAGSH